MHKNIVHCYSFAVVISIFFAVPVHVNAALSTKASNIAAVVRQTVQFQCSTTLPYRISWSYRALGEPTVFVYQFGGIVPRFLPFISVNTSITGQYDLVISNVTIGYAGVYVCFDEEGLETAETASAELVVIDDKLDCSQGMPSDGVFVSDVCGIHPDVINMTCSIKFSGNVAPTLKWKLNDNDIGSNMSTSVIEPNSKATFNLVVRANEQLRNGSYYTGEVYHDFSLSVLKRAQWKSQPINLLFLRPTQTLTFACPPVNVSCHADTNLKGDNYSWNNDATKHTIGKQLLLITSHDAQYLGRYQCTAVYRFRDLSCHVESHVVYVEACPERITQNVTAHGQLKITPKEVVQTVGGTATFTCITKSSALVSFHHLSSFGIERVIYENGELLDTRFKIYGNLTQGQYVLLVMDVLKSDSGVYSCIDNDGIGIRVTAYLSVVEPDKSDDSLALKFGLFLNLSILAALILLLIFCYWRLQRQKRRQCLSEFNLAGQENLLLPLNNFSRATQTVIAESDANCRTGIFENGHASDETIDRSAGSVPFREPNEEGLLLLFTEGDIETPKNDTGCDTRIDSNDNLFSSDGLRDTVRRLQKHIVTKMESDYAFLNLMHSFGLLTKEQADEVSNIQAGEKRNNAILEIICKIEDEESYNRFVTILEEIKQKDLADFIRARGAIDGAKEYLPLESREYRKLLQLNWPKIAESLDIGSIMSALMATGLLNENERQDLTSGSTVSMKIHKFLNMLLRKPKSAYEKLLVILRSTHQEHVANLLDPYADMITLNDYQKCLRKHKTILSAHLECQFGLLKMLRDQDVLTVGQWKSIKVMDLNPKKQNDTLLDIMVAKTEIKEHETFLSAIKECGQSHLSTFIRSNGVVQEESDDRLLTDKILDNFQRNHKHLLIDMKAGELLEHPQMFGCFNDEHIRRIREQNSDQKRNEEMLGIVRHRSMAQFKLFLRCLLETKQEAIAEKLESAVDCSVDLTPMHPSFYEHQVDDGGTKPDYHNGSNSEKSIYTVKDAVMTRVSQLRTRECFGVAYLGNKIFVARRLLIKLVICDAQTYERLPNPKLHLDPNAEVTKWAVINKIQVGDVAACQKNNCLYITDSHYDCVWRWKTDQLVVEEWLVTTISGYRRTLSVTSEGKVILLADEPSRIEIFMPNAIRCASIWLLSDTSSPSHAVEYVSGTVLISHGFLDDIHGVQELSMNGVKLRSWGNQRGSKDDHLDRPRHLAVDQEGRVYVADSMNCRVVVLDKAFKPCGVISNTESLNVHRLCYIPSNSDEDGGRLIVGGDRGRVDIFKIEKLSSNC